MSSPRSLLLLVLGLCALGQAASPETCLLLRRGRHTGFMLRLESPGPRLGWSTPRAMGSVGPLAGLEMGWSVVPGLAAHFAVLDVFTSGGYGKDAELTAASWGPGLTWFADGNVQITGSFRYSAAMRGDQDGAGYLWRLAVIKEFQVTPQNGVGLLVGWREGSWNIQDSSGRWAVHGPEMRLTWTWN